MKKFFSLIAAVLFAGSMIAADQLKATLDFTGTAWNIPTSGTNTEAAQFTDGTYTITLAATTNYKQNDGYLILGKANSTLTLPAFEWKTTKIVVTGRSGASAAVKQNIYVGENAVSTETTGATEANAYAIAADYQAAGNVYVLKVNSAHNTQITKIEVYTDDGQAPTPADTYTVAGAPASVFGEEWNPALAANDMKVANGLYTWEKTELQLTAGKIEFKVVKNHSWDNPAYPAQNYELNIAEAGEYTLTITFDPATETVAAEAVKKEPLADPTNCAEAAAAALSVSKNNEPYNGGKEYSIEGFVTEIATAYSEQYHNITFWMADTEDGGQVLEAYRAACASEEDAPAVGDKVAVTGKLTKYNTTPEFAAGCTFAIIPEPVENPWTEILFEEAVAAADLPNDAVFEFDGLKVAITDSENKMAIDGNKAYFGTADENVQYAFRLKTGGKSQDGTKKNFLNITVPADGDLRLAVRSGNKDDETRNLVLVQEGDTIYNAVVKDADAIEVAINDSTTIKVFPYITVPVKAGEIAVGYPVNSLNFYSFAFQVPVVPEPTWTVAGSSATLFGTTWDPTNKANDMEEVEGIFVWEKEGLELAAGDIAFKVVKDHAWDEAYPSQDYKLAIEEAGIYTIKITFNPESKEVAAEATKTGEAVVLPTIILHGNFSGSWADTEAFVPAEDKLTASLTLDLAEGTYEFGFKFDGAWKANGAVLTREANTTNLAEGSGNMKLTADQAGKYVIVYTYETQEVVVNYPAELKTYDVAEAIAAGLTDGTLVEIRGIITKIEFKGTNFAKYGSANIYVKDITGAEGEFEFYNCYSLLADTFRTSSPEFDPTSTQWAQYDYVVDGNGVKVCVGDTVIAFGKYKLYNSTHELNTGCFLTDLRHAEASGSEIALAFDNGMVDNTYFEEYGTSDIILFNIPVVEGKLAGDGDYLVLDLYPEDPNNITGAYSIAEENLDDYYTYLIRINGTDTAEVAFAAGEVAVEVLAVSVEQSAAQIAVVAALTSTTGDIYTVNAELVVYYDFIEQDVENVAIDLKAIKKVEMGQVIIEKNGVKYNVLGQQVR